MAALSSLFYAQSAHIGTRQEWLARAKRYGARTAMGAAKAHARQNGAAVILNADDSETHVLLNHWNGSFCIHQQEAR